MLKKLQVFFVSNNQYTAGIYKGYFHALGCNLMTISDGNMFSDRVNAVSPDLIFWDFDVDKGFSGQNTQKLLKQLTLSKKVSICGLSNASAKSRLNIEFDEVLVDPTDVAQLDKYIGRKFKRGASFFVSRKNSDAFFLIAEGSQVVEELVMLKSRKTQMAAQQTNRLNVLSQSVLFRLIIN